MKKESAGAEGVVFALIPATRVRVPVAEKCLSCEGVGKHVFPPLLSSVLRGRSHGKSFCCRFGGQENEAREIRTPNLLIWSQTRCRCAIAPREGSGSSLDERSDKEGRRATALIDRPVVRK